MICSILFVIGVLLLIALILIVIYFLSEDTRQRKTNLGEKSEFPEDSSTIRGPHPGNNTFHPETSSHTETSYLSTPSAPPIVNPSKPPGLPQLKIDVCPILPKDAPRRNDITDYGYIDNQAGYYDVCGRGQCNDFCRWVGNPDEKWFSCALAGATSDQYGVQMDPDAIGRKCDSAPAAAVTPVTRESLMQYCAILPSNAPRRTDVTDLGYNDNVRGYYDLCNRGQCNDFCRTVGQSGGYYISCALAGSTGDQYEIVADPSLLESKRCGI